MRGRGAEEVSDEEIEGDIDSKEEKHIKERSFVWSHFFFSILPKLMQFTKLYFTIISTTSNPI